MRLSGASNLDLNSLWEEVKQKEDTWKGDP